MAKKEYNRQPLVLPQGLRLDFRPTQPNTPLPPPKPSLLSRAANFGVGFAREFPKGLMRIANEIPQTPLDIINPTIGAPLRFLRQPPGTRRETTPQGPVIRPTHPLTKKLLGSEEIKTATADTQDIFKSLTNKNLSAPIALPLGLFLNTPVGPGKLFRRGLKPITRTAVSGAAPQATASAEKSLKKAQKTTAKLRDERQAWTKRYNQPLPTKFKGAVVRSYDPFSEAVKIDRAYSKQLGIKYRDLPASQRLEHKLDQALNARFMAQNEFDRPLTSGVTARQLITKHQGVDEEDFMNYANAKFDLEFRKLHRNKPIQKGITTRELNNLVRVYEKSNPQAKKDLAALKELNDRAVDILAQGGMLSLKEADYIKGSYKNAVPLSRIIPENLQRPKIDARPLGSIGKQTVIRKLVGNSEIPLEASFTPLIKRLTAATQQASRGEAARLYAERVLGGSAQGRILVGAGNKEVRKENRQTMAEINKTIRVLKRRLAKTKNPSTKEKTIQKIKDLEEAKSVSKETIINFSDDPTTNKQVVSGVIDGQPFKIETTPEVARMLQGLGQADLPSVLRASYAVTKTFQTFWTGFLNFVFPLMSFFFYDPAASVIISKHGFRTFSPTALRQMFRSFKSSDAFAEALQKHGYAPPGGSMLARDPSLSAEKIAASRSLFKKISFGIKNPKELLDMVDVLGGKLANASRQRIAKAHYAAAKKAGLSEADALNEAVFAANNVLPNYQRTSSLVKQLNAGIPYSAASVAGVRSIIKALRNDPMAWVRLSAVGLAPPIAVTAYSFATEEGREYYRDILESGKGYLLDNSLAIALPGAHKDPTTGKWTGVWRIPVAPELRPLNRAMWRATASFIDEESRAGNPAGAVALAIFDTITGGLRGQSNPIIDAGLIAGLGLDPQSLKPLHYGDKAFEDKQEQSFPHTSGAAKGIAKLTGYRVSPIQADELLGQLGLVGKVAQNKGGNPVASVATSIKGRFEGGYGRTESKIFYDDFNSLLSSSKLSPDDRKAIIAIYSKNPFPGILDSAEKATIYLNRPAVLNFSRQLDRKQRERGKMGNPLFDLTDDQLKRVLVYRHAKMLRAGKQVYDKNGNPLFLALGLDSLWYSHFRDKETAYFNDIAKKKSSVTQASSQTFSQTFSGIPRPPKSTKIEVLEKAYYSLPKGTYLRRAFLEKNPELLAWWEGMESFTNAERKAIGLEVYDKLAGGLSPRRTRVARAGRSRVGVIKTPSVKKIATKKPKKTKPPKITVKAPAQKIKVKKLPNSLTRTGRRLV